MKRKTRLIIGIAVLSILVPTLVVVIWLLEKNRTPRYETLAGQALQDGDWEKAADYAEQAGSDTLRFEAVYAEAEALLQSGETERAEQAFLSLGTFRDAPARVQECRYAAAEALERAGDDAAAGEAFAALVPYADSLDRYRACRYRIAERLLAEGDTRAAFAAFAELVPYADAEARMEQIAVSLTGETDPQKAVAFAKGYSEADWLRMEQTSEARNALKRGRIAVGNAHAVFLFSDGHAEAVGDGSNGECNVAAFYDLTAVAAGYSHKIGRKTDGTAVAAGDNTYGQCDVGDWSDVVSIACGAWDTFGVRADGTLLHCGFSEYDLTGWTELRSVRACETALIGVRKDGTLLCTAAVGRYTGGSYCDACITTGAAFALTDEGTLRCASDALADCNDLVAVLNSASVLIGVRTDGTLAVHPLIPCNADYLADLKAQTSVAEVAPGGSFALVLHRDGTVSGCGDLPPAVAEFLAQEPAL